MGADILCKVKVSDEKIKHMTVLEICISFSRMNKEQKTEFLNLNSVINVNLENATAIRFKDDSQSECERVAFFEKVNIEQDK